MRGLTKLWRPLHATSDSPLSEPLVARILRARGLVGPEASAFLEPSLKQLHDPALLPDLDRAAARLLDALRRDEQIVIYGDYDVDGITASAILYHTLHAVAPGISPSTAAGGSARVKTYVPHRLDEGYGLNTKAIQALANEGANVIVSVDCGVTAVDPALAARDAGATLIITDHHTPPARVEDLPQAFAVVHPLRPGATPYPDPSLSGSAVAFKLAWRLATMAAGSERVGDAMRGLLLDLLALASLGVIADVVPLRGENRAIARAGLAKMRHTRFEGLNALIEASGLGNAKIHEEDVGFKLAPRINAVGRLGHAREAVELLTTAQGVRAAAIAEELTRLNERRQAEQRDIVEIACELAEMHGMTGPDKRGIVLAHKDWHQGIVGIVCSKLVEKYARPTILMQDHGEFCQGSGRSVEGFSLHGALCRCSEHLAHFGGHDMAAGVKVATSQLPAFTEAFLAACNEGLGQGELVASTRYDTTADLSELSMQCLTHLRQLAPFGSANPSVVLRVGPLKVLGRPTTFGAQGKHLSINARSGASTSGGAAMRFYAWNWGEHLRAIPEGASIEALVTPKISDFSGRVECEIRDVVVRSGFSTRGPETP